MWNKFVKKINCLIVMTLFIIITIGVSWADFTFPTVREAGTTTQLTVAVDGTTVNFDWSSMPDANSYTLAVALTDALGDIDMGSLKLIDMESQKVFTASGLPSGTVFNVAILADTDQGLVVSNKVRFMPFAGTVSSLGRFGEVSFEINDPGGVGEITLFVNVTTSYFLTFTQLSGDDGTGPFVLMFTGDKPSSYSKGDSTMTFKSLADGSITVENFRERVSIGQSTNDCEAAINGKIVQLTKDFIFETNMLQGLTRTLSVLSMGSLKMGKGSYRCSFLRVLFADTINDLKIKFSQDMAALKKQYDECQGP